ncbi:MAG: hypothetical protein HY287_18015 [Planctomycetes bacterium]|nr:hypothetical protein [Planctomycetota bacterium]
MADTTNQASASFGAGLLGPGVQNHPVGIRPTSGMSLPRGWPIAADGSITCMTCHVTLPIPGAKVQLRGSENGSPDNPQSFCANCHSNNVQSREGAHWMALMFAHVSRQYNREAAAGVSAFSSSRACLGCHDGVNASEAAYAPAGAEFGGSLGDRSRNHPIDVSYPMSGKKRAEVPLRPASMVPASVNLRGGVVSCLSCHDLYNHEKSMLSVPIEGSRLCFGCHALD